MKKQIDLEIAQDLSKLEHKLIGMMKDMIEASERRSAETAKRDNDAVRKDVDAKVATAKNQIVVANNNQLATVQESTRQMIQAVGQQVTNAAYKKVIADINRDIVPKVNNMVEYVNYQMQDSGEIITDYRRAVNNQANGGGKSITDGNDKHIISEHVSMFFRDDE